MAYDINNLLGTPENYATPEQLSSMRDYSKVLTANSLQPVHHWTQGISNIVNALVGGLEARKSDLTQRNALQQAAHDLPSYGDSPSSAPTGAPVGNITTGDATPTDENARRQAAVAGIESGGKYNLTGPVIKTGAYAGDKAYGKYQVMGKNIPEWTKAALGKEMTPEEFLANPQAQDAVFNHKFGQLSDKYGPVGASKAWFAGEGGMVDPNRKDQLGTSVQSYANQFAKSYGGDGGSLNPAQTAITRALDPNGVKVASADGSVPIPTARPDVAATVAALNPNAGATPAPTPAGGPPQAGPPPVTSPQAPAPTQVAQNGPAAPGGSPVVGTFVPPEVFPHRQSISREQYERTMASPLTSPEQRKLAADAYAAQNQPLSMPYKGLGTVFANPRNPSQQWFVPDVQKDEIDVNGVKTPVRRFYNIKTDQMETVPVHGAQGGSDVYSSGNIPAMVNAGIDNAAKKKGAEEFATERMKGVYKPVGEQIEKGGMAVKATNYLNMMDQIGSVPDADKINTGPMAQTFLKAKQGIKDVFGLDLGGIAPAEAIEKFNGFLASEAAKEMTNRPTQFDFKTFLDRNPGITVSPEGRKLLIDSLKQGYQQDAALAGMASKIKTPEEAAAWPETRQKYLDEHPIVFNYRGQPITSADKVPEFQGMAQPSKVAPPGDDAIGELKKNPSPGRKILFEKTFQLPAGSADKLLKGQ